MGDRSVILIAEDEEDSVILLEMAFEKAGVEHPRRVVRNGQEAIDYLRGEGVYADREEHPWPALMLLDLKMPMIDGFGVLSWWREQEGRRELPIVIMSASNREADIARALELGAAAYQVKPSDFNYLIEVARGLRERWLSGRRPGIEQRTRESRG